MDKVVDELDNMLSNLSLDNMDDIITRMERMQIHRNRDSDVEGLISAMGSLSTVPNNKKLQVALEGVKRTKQRFFARKFKSLKGKKTKALSKNQMSDIFATMNALKEEEEETLDFGDLMAELDAEMNGGAKKKRKMRRQKGGMRLNKLPKDLEKIITNYKKQLEEQEKKQKSLRKQIDQKYIRLQKLENKEPLTDKEAIELMTVSIEIPIYVKFYLLNGGDYWKLLISKEFRDPDDLEIDESLYEYQDEKDILKKVKKTLYGGAKKKRGKPKKGGGYLPRVSRQKTHKPFNPDLKEVYAKKRKLSKKPAKKAPIKKQAKKKPVKKSKK